MKPLRVSERRVQAQDGTELACHAFGEGLPVLLCGGLGGNWKAWTHQIAYLSDSYSFLSWDYRGLYRSGMPEDPAALTVHHHASDGICVLNDAKVERAALFGWSMGAQVALEMFQKAPDRVAALVLINGVAGKPWEAVMGLRLMAKVLPQLIGTVRTMPHLTEAVVRRVVHWPETVQWVKRMGIAGRTLDDDLFQELAAGFAGLDMDVYMHILELAGEHDATEVLDDIDVPTLVIAGDRDIFTPRSAAERMVRRISGAELMIVPGGAHYVAIEYPELVNLRIEKFFRERGYVELPSDAA